MEMDIKELCAYFDERYVQKDACTNRHERTDAKINDIAITQERMLTKMDLTSKVDMIILTASIGAIVTGILNLLFK